MKVLLDTANLEEIRRGMDEYPLGGVTTNPTLLSKERQEMYPLLKTIREEISPCPLHIQVMGENASDMVREAEAIRQWLGDGIYIKIPVNREGIKAIRELKKGNIRVTATAVYSREQAFLAGLAGADYVAPYYNRMENLSIDSKTVIRDISAIYHMHGIQTKLLAASFKNCSQVMEAIKAGADEVTIPLQILDLMIENAVIRHAVSAFRQDWEQRYRGVGILDLLEKGMPQM